MGFPKKGSLNRGGASRFIYRRLILAGGRGLVGHPDSGQPHRDFPNAGFSFRWSVISAQFQHFALPIFCRSGTHSLAWNKTRMDVIGQDFGRHIGQRIFVLHEEGSEHEVSIADLRRAVKVYFARFLTPIFCDFSRFLDQFGQVAVLSKYGLTSGFKSAILNLIWCILYFLPQVRWGS